jgi:hypothetical protein
MTERTRFDPVSASATQRHAPTNGSSSVLSATRGDDDMVATLQKLVHEGNVRRIFIDDEDGTTLIEIPLLLGIRGGPHLEPVWAAAGALGRLASNLTIRVQLEEAWPKYND